MKSLNTNSANLLMLRIKMILYYYTLLYYAVTKYVMRSTMLLKFRKDALQYCGVTTTHHWETL